MEGFEVCSGQRVSWKLESLYGTHCWLCGQLTGPGLPFAGKIGGGALEAFSPSCKKKLKKGKRERGSRGCIARLYQPPSLCPAAFLNGSGNKAALGQRGSGSRPTWISLSALPLAACAKMSEHLGLSKAK